MSTIVDLSVLGDRRRLTAPQAKKISSKLDQFPPLPFKVWNKDFFQNQQNFVPPNQILPGLFPVSTAMENPSPTYANLTTNQSSRNSRIRLQTKPHKIQNGKYLVSFSKEENEMLAQTCKWTILGKFSQIRPSIDIIQREFTKIIPGKEEEYSIALSDDEAIRRDRPSLTCVVADQSNQEAWSQDQEGNAQQVLHKKLKATIKALSTWSRIEFRDFHEEPKRLENIIKDPEESSINNNTPENRINLYKAKAEFTRFLKIQEKVLSQKGRIKWLEDGDTYSAFFHRVIKDKRKRLSIHKIKDQEGNWVEGTTQVADAAVNFFTNLFKAEPTEKDSNIFNLVERFVTIKDNNNLNSLPTLQEIKDTVFSIDSDNASEPDGLNGKFYQSTWQIIAADLHAAIISFF
ncbi:hypothetical protein H5410_015005 [Solanum commersonii]|uniref:Uncharacterized protein n=1 Tax=Solanum commersonii TaxID=4109 RepID=A0A9J5ZSD3_SOLCO|nr:hypothetical protein H5410_015005 [Solanum commersonii]